MAANFPEVASFVGGECAIDVAQNQGMEGALAAQQVLA
jgi:hypothetical protein